MFTRPLRHISGKDIRIAGGKGAGLGELMRCGIAVPDGFVVVASAFDQFLRETDLGVEIDAALDTVNLKKMHTVERAAERITSLITRENIPPAMASEIDREARRLGGARFAVRSSGANEDGKRRAWAGQLESFLGVPREHLSKYVRQCWASAFSPRAIFYGREIRRNRTSPSVAVVVEKMVPADVAGICFTAHPLTGDRKQIVIEAVYGLGEKLAGGTVTPDTYVVRKDTGELLDTNISSQRSMAVLSKKGVRTVVLPKAKQWRQKLSAKEIRTLAKLCGAIESKRGAPQDIEWAYAGGKFFILQARPITTLDQKRAG